MIYKVLVINLMGLVLCSTQHPTLKLNIVSKNNILTCENTTATVLEGEPLKIKVNYSSTINKIRCRHNTDDSTNFTEASYNKVTNVDHVTVAMGTVWRCTILTLEGILMPPLPTAPCGNDAKNILYCVSIDCQITMHVRRKEAPQVILVNNMLLPSKRAELRESHDALAEYTFNEGDLVHVTCANPREQTCKLTIDYDAIDNINLTMKRSNPAFTSKEPVGFQLRMRAANDKTYALCTCVLGDDITTVRVNFLMRKHIDANSINVYINDAALRTTAQKMSDYNVVYEYLYKPNEGYNVKCENDTIGDSITFRWISKPKGNNEKLFKGTKGVTMYFNLRDEQEVSFDCKTSQYKVMVKLKQRELNEALSSCTLRTEIKRLNTIVNTSLQQYESTKQYYIYEYEDNDNLILTCTASCNQDTFSKALDEDKKTKTRVLKKIIDKSEIDRSNVFQCKLNNTDTLFINTVMFVRYVPTTTAKTTTPTSTTPTAKTTTTSSITTSTSPGTTSTTTKTLQSDAIVATPAPNSENTNSGADKSGMSPFLAAVVSVACIILICVLAGFYKIRKRKNKQRNTQWQPGEVNYENLTNNNDSPIPLLLRQSESTDYAEPVDRAADPTYCEPSTGPRANIKTELYTLPIPKARRKMPANNQKPANNQITEPTYEELDVDLPTGILNAKEDPNYSEVAPNANLDIMYSEITPKTEPKSGSEYSNVKGKNPNYAQVVPKSMRRKKREGGSGSLQDAGGSLQGAGGSIQGAGGSLRGAGGSLQGAGGSLQGAGGSLQCGGGSIQGQDGIKYANVQDGRYVNANSGSEYAEPAYCEPTYLNNKK